MATWKRWLLLLGAAVCVGGISDAFTYPDLPLGRWLYSKTVAVDILSGRVRTTTTFAGVYTTEQTSESWLSQFADQAAAEPDWRTVSSRSLGASPSPHYRFHAAVQQIHVVETVSLTCVVSEDRQAHVATQILHAWQTTNDDSEAERVIRSYFEEVAENER